MLKIGNIELPEFPLLLAPMEDVSDPPFRALCKEQGADVVYTEFISSEGLIRNAAKSTKKLDIYTKERPVGIQIFGSNLDSMLGAVDILMVSLTKEIVERTKLPVTVKTRLGWDEKSIKIVEVAERLQDVGIKAISIHGRTRAQMYKGFADWTKIAEIKNNPRMHIPVFGNGDVNTPEKAKEMRDEFGLDGAMIGRASIGNPWFFDQVKHYLKTGDKKQEPTIAERAEMAIRHLKMSVEWKGEVLGVLETRRHYGNYFKGIANFKDTKSRILNEKDPETIIKELEGVKKNFSEAVLY